MEPNSEEGTGKKISIVLQEESSVTVSSSSSSSSSDGTGSDSDLSDSDKNPDSSDPEDDALKDNPDPVFSEQRIPKRTESGINRGKATISDVVQSALSRIDGLLSVTSMLPRTEPIPIPPKYTLDFNDVNKTASVFWHPT